jgi:hypothetical protein
MRKFLGVFLILSFNSFAATRVSPLDEAKNSYLDFSTEVWNFRIDPEQMGEQEGWAKPDFDDQGWNKIYAGEAWESQDFSYYNGHAWYRKRVWIPEEWRGSVVRFEVDGVGDEYDLFINAYLDAELAYSKLISLGMKKEDARYVLPNAATTSLYVTGNFQAWKDFINLRSGKEVQWEIREVAQEIHRQLKGIAPNVFD